MEAAHWHGWCASSKTIRSPDNRAGSHSGDGQPETARLKTQRAGPKLESHGKLSRARRLDRVPKSFAFIVNPERSSLGGAETPDVSIFHSCLWVAPSAINVAWLNLSNVFPWVERRVIRGQNEHLAESVMSLTCRFDMKYGCAP